jgi:hypothetical protein
MFKLPVLTFFPFFDFELANRPPTIFSFLTTLFTALLNGANHAGENENEAKKKIIEKIKKTCFQ